MGLSDVRPFVRARMNALGFSEHDQPFNIESLAESNLDDAYYIESLTTQGTGVNQRTASITYPIKIHIFKAGYASPLETYDELDSIADTVINDFLAPSVRNGVNIKDIELSLVDRVPLAESNDNAMVLELSFDFKLLECFD